MILLEVAMECRGGIYMTVDDLAPHESVEFLVNNEVFFYAGNLTVPARPDSGMDMHQGLRDLDRNQMPMTMTRWIRMMIPWKGRRTRRVG